MNINCPHCNAHIDVADDKAGESVACPECGDTFTAPQKFTPVVPPVEESDAEGEATSPSPIAAEPPPPTPTPSAPPASKSEPPPVEAKPPAAQTPVTPAAAAKPVPATDGDESHTTAFTFDPDWVVWLPVVCMTLVFFFSFFKWVGMFPAGYHAYSQNAWQCLFAGLSVDPVSEEVLQLNEKLSARLYSNWWMLLYLVLMVGTVVAVWSDRLATLQNWKIPKVWQVIDHYRAPILAIVCTLGALTLIAQSTLGFGLEHAVQSIVKENPVNVAAYENATTPEKQQKAEMLTASEKGSYHLHVTWAYRLALYLHLLSAVALSLTAYLSRKPLTRPIRLTLQY